MIQVERRLVLALLASLGSACFASNREQRVGPADAPASAGSTPSAGAAGSASGSRASGAAGAGASVLPVEPCDAECACDGGRFTGVWVCHDDGSAVCSCTDAASRGEACTPGVHVSCTCVDGRLGSQVCADDGRSFGDCGCES